MANPVPGASPTCGSIRLSLTDFARVVFPPRGLSLLGPAPFFPNHLFFFFPGGDAGTLPAGGRQVAEVASLPGQAYH